MYNIAAEKKNNNIVSIVISQQYSTIALLALIAAQI